MKNYLAILIAISSLVATSNFKAIDGIRLYQENDHAQLRDMLANNDELLILADAEHPTRESRLAFTERYLSSNNYITKVYSKNSVPVGFITYVKEGFSAPIFDVSKPTIIPEPQLQGAIQLLAVKEEDQKQGIGKILLTDALEYMKSKGIKAIMVQTKVTNAASRHLYEKMGFKLLFPILPGMPDCFYRIIFE